MKDPKKNPEPPGGESDSISGLGRKRLIKFVTLYASALIETDSKTVHDLRVASRRLQQILVAQAAPSAAKDAKKLRRFLRGIRQALSELRNLDVIGRLAQARSTSAASEAARAAWTEISGEIARQRAAESARAQQALEDYDMTAFLERTRRVLNRVGAADDSVTGLGVTVTARYQAWNEALSTVGEDPAPAQLHALRIAGKRLRYLLELQTALADPQAKALARSLAELQDQLGDWHDGHVLRQFAGDYLRREEFLAEHPGESRALLMDMERERRRANGQAQEALEAARKFRTNWPARAAENLEN